MAPAPASTRRGHAWSAGRDGMLALVVDAGGWRSARTSPAAGAQTGPRLHGDAPDLRGPLQGRDDRQVVARRQLAVPARSQPTSGIAGGWWRDQPGTAGWSAVTVPNSYNAGDLSVASMNGYVGWYRRDFTLPGRGVRVLRAGALSQLDRSLRVGQLPGHGVAERPPGGDPCRRLPAVRVRPEGASGPASTGWSSASMIGAPPPIFRPARAEAGSTSAVCSARSICARFSVSTCRPWS